MKEKDDILTIVIGGDMDKDDAELLDPKKPFDQIKQGHNMVYLNSYEELDWLLSPARLDLLCYLMKMKRKDVAECVSQIAKELKRKQEAISRDLHYLKGLKLVELQRVKQAVVASTKFGSISIITK